MGLTGLSDFKKEMAKDAKEVAEVKTEKAEKEVAAATAVKEQPSGLALSEEERKVLATDRKNLAFVKLLGNPAIDDVRNIVLEDGKKDTLRFPKTVGARFKVLKDMMIPDCGTDSRFRSDNMNFVNIDNWVEAKAGQEVDLTLFEVGLLLSQARFNGGCDGGEIPVRLSYAMKNAVDKSGKAITVASASKTPVIALVPGNAATGSLKEMGYINVLECTKVKNEKGKTHVASMTINKGFEKWSPLCERAAKRASVAGAGSTTANNDPYTVVNMKCRQFLAFAEKAKQQQQKN